MQPSPIRPAADSKSQDECSRQLKSLQLLATNEPNCFLLRVACARSFYIAVAKITFLLLPVPTPFLKLD